MRTAVMLSVATACALVGASVARVAVGEAARLEPWPAAVDAPRAAAVFGDGEAATAPPALAGDDARPAARARIRKAADGHYWAWADENGARVRVLVDTGSSAVALTLADARALGVPTDELSYGRAVVTAMGSARAAPVVLDDLSVGGVRVEHVSALVMKAGLPASLLGMSYLGRLSGFEAGPGGLVLKR